jgi:hypothetical protein
VGTSPDRIAEDIADTRAELAADVDRLADRTSPKRIVRRRMDRVRERMSGARETVMGRAEQTAGAVRSAPEQAMQQAQGNPLAAGLIAFGAGLLAASLLPRSGPEQRAGQQLREQGAELVEPVKQAVTESAQHVAEDLKPQAKQAADEVKQAAQQARQE